MKEEPFVSIVLPTFNGSRYLDESIQSCRAQTHTHWELIIVDDASTDSTPEIISGWIAKDSRIRRVRNEKNRKLPASLNFGFRQAKGQFLTWTSDDNLYRPSAIAEMLAYMQMHPEVALVYSDFTEIDELGKPVNYVQVAEPSALAYVNCVRASFLYRAEVQTTVGDYSEDFVLVEDWDFWLRTARHFRLGRLAKDLYLYRWHSNSLTLQRKAEVLNGIERLLASHLPSMKWAGRDSRAMGYLKLTDLAEDAGRSDMSNTYFRKALLEAPFLAVRGRRAKLLAVMLGPTLASFLVNRIKGVTRQRVC
jgi:glycosyltransferase involved in cell wall biosynthesis